MNGKTTLNSLGTTHTGDNYLKLSSFIILAKADSVYVIDIDIILQVRCVPISELNGQQYDIVFFHTSSLHN